MLLLTSPNDQLQIVTSAAATVNVHASWVDTNTAASTVTPGRTNSAISTAATTSVAGSPAAGVQRNVKTLHVRNTHPTLACDVTVQHTDGTVVAQLYKLTLNPTEMLEYTDQAGFTRGGALVGTQTLGGTLTVVSPTLLKFSPYRGGYIKHNGVLRPIPVAGIAGLANANVRVGNVPGQNLTGNTTYLLFATDVNGVLTADFHQGVIHAPSQTPGNEGTEIMWSSAGVGPADNFSLIGMVRTNASAQFANGVDTRLVRSWFDREPVAVVAPSISTGTAYTVTFSSLGSQVSFVSWTSETVAIRIDGFMYGTPAGTEGYDGILVDITSGGASGSITEHRSVSDFAQGAVACSFMTSTLAEGYHFASIGAFTGGGSVTTGAACTALLGGPRSALGSPP